MAHNSLFERRKYLRVERNCILRHEPLTESILFEQSDKKGKRGGLVINVSAGGILFETNQPYEIGAVLKVECKLPGWEKFKNGKSRSGIPVKAEPLIIVARVMRVEMVTDGVYDIGLSIASIDEEHREILKKYLAEHNKNPINHKKGSV